MSEDIEFQKFLELQRARRVELATRDREMRARKDRENHLAKELLQSLPGMLHRIVSELQAPDLYDLDFAEGHGPPSTLRMHFALVGPSGRAYRQSNGNGALELVVSDGEVKLRSRANERTPMVNPSIAIERFSEEWLRKSMKECIKGFFRAQAEGRTV